MALRDQPYMPIYVQDYLTDERLLMCNWSTQGIYARILFNLHKQAVYGAILFKQTSKQNVSTAEYFAGVLCKLIPCQIDEMIAAVDELIDNRVLLFDGEMLYQKRMYNDGQISVKRSFAAKSGGGNPVLKPSKKRVKTDENLFKQNPKQNTEDVNVNENKDINEDREKGGTGGKGKPITPTVVDLQTCIVSGEEWRISLPTYQSTLRECYKALKNDAAWLAERKRLNPRVDVLLTLEKVCIEYWSTEDGWAQKKKSKSAINWKTTLAKSIGQKFNHVYENGTGNNQGKRGNALDGDYLADLARRAGVSN